LNDFKWTFLQGKGKMNFKHFNFFVNAPQHIPNKKFLIKCVSLDLVRAVILTGTRENLSHKYVPIIDTPHYSFVVGHPKLYLDYIEEYGELVGNGIEHSRNNFEQLIYKFNNGLAYLNYPFTNCYIICEEIQTRFGKEYLLLDGVHRAAILASKNISRIPVALVNDSITSRDQITQFVNDFKDDFLEWYTPLKIDDNLVINERTYPTFIERPEFLINHERGLSKWDYIISRNLPDIKDFKIYDVGCNVGIFCLEMAKLGARTVIGIDRDEVVIQPTNPNLPKQDVINQAYFVKKIYEIRDGVDYSNVNYFSYDIANLDFSKIRAEMVFSSNVLYHFGEKFESYIEKMSENIPVIFLQTNLGHKDTIGHWVSIKTHEEILKKYGYEVRVDAPNNYDYPVIVGTKDVKPIIVNSYTNLSSNSSKCIIKIVIFSKDRALQLDGMLKSFFSHCIDLGLAEIMVLFTVSNDYYLKQYEILINDYTEINFIEENDFKRDLIRICSDSDYIGYFVDDNIFIKDFSLQQIYKCLSNLNQSAGFSLRLGKNISYSYMADEVTIQPEFISSTKDVLQFDWTEAKGDFGYPWELSSSIYRAEDIYPIISSCNYTNPNSLETVFYLLFDWLKTRKKYLLCFETSVVFSNPLNRVQNYYLGNRVSGRSNSSEIALSRMFNRGYRISESLYNNIKTFACHQEMDLAFNKLPSYSETITAIVLTNKGTLKFYDTCNSIFHQTFNDFKLIVLTDVEQLELNEVTGKFDVDGKKVEIKILPNSMAVKDIYNFGLSISNGEFIIYIDCGDYLSPTMFEEAINLLDSDPEIDFIYTDFTVIGNGKNWYASREKWECQTKFDRLFNIPYCSMIRTSGFTRKIGLGVNIESSDFKKNHFITRFYLQSRRVAKPLCNINSDLTFHDYLVDKAEENISLLNFNDEKKISKNNDENIQSQRLVELIEQANDAFNIGDFNLAAVLLEESLKIEPENTDIQQIYGNILLRKGEIRKAEIIFKSVVSERPDNVMGYINLAGTLIIQGNIDEAKIVTLLAAQINSEAAEVQQLLTALNL
jgi:SAM-dependent methyltransferase